MYLKDWVRIDSPEEYKKTTGDDILLNLEAGTVFLKEQLKPRHLKLTKQEEREGFAGDGSSLLQIEINE